MADIETLAATKRTHAEGAAPATPSAAEVVIYAKSDGLMYSKDDAGAETLMSSGAALSNPMTTAEDIIKGGASGTPGRVALGASNTALASSNSTLAYVPLGTKAFAPDSLGASSAPTAANDFTQGWRRGSRWIDTVTDKEYVCLDETTGAAVWTETTGAGGGTGPVELDYVERTTPLTVTSTSEAAPQDLIVGNEVAYDGSTAVWVECFMPSARPATGSAGKILYFNLLDGTTSVGRLGYLRNDAAAAGHNAPVFLRRRLTPEAGNHTYKVVCWASNTDADVTAGAGGSGNFVPAYLRIVTA